MLQVLVPGEFISSVPFSSGASFWRDQHAQDMLTALSKSPRYNTPSFREMYNAYHHLGSTMRKNMQLLVIMNKVQFREILLLQLVLSD